MNVASTFKSNDKFDNSDEVVEASQISKMNKL